MLVIAHEPFPALEDQEAFTDRTSPEPSGPFCNANTGVFWDVRDYRIPDLFDPDLVRQKITEAVLDAGYTGDVSIHLWIAKNEHSDHLLQLYSAAKIPITFLPKDDELEMIHNIVVGILLWSLDNPGPANVMVVSEHISYDMLESLQILRNKDYRVLLSSPPEESDTDIFPCGSLDWLHKSLSPPNKKKRPIADSSDSEDSDSEDSDNSAYLIGVNPSPMRYSSETSETMWSEFPPAPAGCDGREIFVLWDVNDPSILERVDPRATSNKIRTALLDKGYYGEDSIWAFYDFDSVDDHLCEMFASSGIFFQQVFRARGGKTIRSTVVAYTTLFPAMSADARANPSCLLVLSEDKGFQTIVDALKRHRFQAGLFKPNEFLCFKPEEQQCGSSQADEETVLCTSCSED